MGLYPPDAALELGGGKTPRQPARAGHQVISVAKMNQSVGWISEVEPAGVALGGLADSLLCGVVELVALDVEVAPRVPGQGLVNRRG